MLEIGILAKYRRNLITSSASSISTASNNVTFGSSDQDAKPYFLAMEPKFFNMACVFFFAISNGRHAEEHRTLLKCEDILAMFLQQVLIKKMN